MEKIEFKIKIIEENYIIKNKIDDAKKYITYCEVLSRTDNNLYYLCKTYEDRVTKEYTSLFLDKVLDEVIELSLQNHTCYLKNNFKISKRMLICSLFVNGTFANDTFCNPRLILKE